MRVQVNVSDDLVKKIDEYAKVMGVSRSALCSVWIGQAVMGMDRSFQVVQSMGDKLGEALLAEKTLAEMGQAIGK